MLFTLPLIVDKNSNQQIVIISIFQDMLKKKMLTGTKENESTFKLHGPMEIFIGNM